jgi:hypothetical protein
MPAISATECPLSSVQQRFRHECDGTSHRLLMADPGPTRTLQSRPPLTSPRRAGPDPIAVLRPGAIPTAAFQMERPFD